MKSGIFPALVCFAVLSISIANDTTMLSSTQINTDLLQEKRPPQQTQTQGSIRSQNTQNAQSESSQAWQSVYDLMQWVLDSGGIEGISIMQGMNAQDLMNIIEWEFKHAPVIHNGAIRTTDQDVTDDADLFTTFTNGYIQNVCQRYLMGYLSSYNLWGEGGIQTSFYHYPQFKNEFRPSLREANDRPNYFALNWEKLDTGNTVFGKATYVLNPLYYDKVFVAPFDSGAFAYNQPSLPIGTMTDFWHLIWPHLNAYKYDISWMFWRWYGGHSKIGIDLLYFEVMVSANVWVPDAIHYVIAKYDELWGYDEGAQLQIWMNRNGRPLVWANGDDSGLLIDPTVNWVSPIDSGFIKSWMIKQFHDLWFAPPDRLSWYDFYNKQDNAIRFEFPQVFLRQSCEPFEYANSPYMVMGTNHNYDCVYWKWEQDINVMLWECLNDGGCERSARGNFLSYEDCSSACSGQKWSHQQNKYITGNAEWGATFCVQNTVDGPYATLDACEKSYT